MFRWRLPSSFSFIARPLSWSSVLLRLGCVLLVYLALFGRKRVCGEINDRRKIVQQSALVTTKFCEEALESDSNPRNNEKRSQLSVRNGVAKLNTSVVHIGAKYPRIE